MPHKPTDTMVAFAAPKTLIARLEHVCGWLEYPKSRALREAVSLWLETVEEELPINGTNDRAQGPDGKVIAPAPHD